MPLHKEPAHAKRLRLQLGKLDTAKGPDDMGMPGWKLHAIEGNLAGHWSVWVNGNWRMTSTFEDGDAILVDFRDYH